MENEPGTGGWTSDMLGFDVQYEQRVKRFWGGEKIGLREWSYAEVGGMRLEG